MLFNAIKASLMVSAVSSVSGAILAEGHTVAMTPVKRYNPYPYPHLSGYTGPTGGAVAGGTSVGAGVTGGFSAGGGAAGGVSTGGGVAGYAGGDARFGAVVQAWAALTPAITQLQSSISSGASIDAVYQQTIKVAAQVQSASYQYSSISASSSSQMKVQFESTAVQFFSSMQLFLAAAQQHYGAQWNSRFHGISAQFASGFTCFKRIASSLHVDLAAAIHRAHVDVNLFATVGLNLSALLQFNVSVDVGSLVHL